MQTGGSRIKSGHENINKPQFETAIAFLIALPGTQSGNKMEKRGRKFKPFLSLDHHGK